MANNGKDAEKDAAKSLGARFMDHARGPMGLASIVKEIKYALTDIRHKVVEEATYGRAVTPHWRDTANPPQATGGIHGKTETPADGAGPGIHGKADVPKPDTPSPDAGGVHGKAVEPVGSKSHQAEPKGLGMSYAELTASWDKACESGRATGHEREPARQPEQAIER